MKKIVFGCLGFLVIALLFTNPTLSDFERYTFKGMGTTFVDNHNEKMYREVFSTVGISRLASRQDYLFFSTYEISPGFISSISIEVGNPSPFTFDFSNTKVLFLGIGGNFYALGQSSRSVNAIFGFFELCRTGAIDCRRFIRKYGL